MPKGKIIEFAQEKGFGKIQLEDGTILNFDGSVLSTFDVQPGAVGEIEFREIRGRKIIAKIEIEE